MDQELLTRIADELMIKNMIDAINSPVIEKELLSEDKVKILKVIKEHILKNTELLEANNHTRKR